MMARETKEYRGRVNRKQDVFNLEDVDALAITTAAQMRTKHQQMAQNRVQHAAERSFWTFR
jgi:hypothetical protein